MRPKNGGADAEPVLRAARGLVMDRLMDRVMVRVVRAPDLAMVAV